MCVYIIIDMVIEKDKVENSSQKVRQFINPTSYGKITIERIYQKGKTASRKI